MAGAQPQPDYRYIPPSAKSTRQLLESTSPISPSPSTSTNDPSVPFRPQILSRQKSSNYAEAEADARVRAAAQAADSTPSLTQEDAAGEERNETTGTTAGRITGTVGWRPKVGRKQSWNQQDLKRVMQMSVMNESQGLGKELGPGFSEVGTATKQSN